MQEVSSIVFMVIITSVMVGGLFSLVLPFLPGLWVMWIGALVYGIVDGFDATAWIMMAIISVLTVVGGLMDNIFMGGNARRVGTSWLAIGVSLVGVLIGSALLTPLGGLAIGLGAMFAVEYFRMKDWRKAWESTKSMALGCGWGVLARFGFGVLVLIAWVIWAFVLK